MSVPRQPRAKPNDPVVLAEATLSLLVLALFLGLYVVPTRNRLSGLHWWAPVVLGGLSLALLLLDSWRRRRQSRRAVQRTIEDQRGGDL